VLRRVVGDPLANSAPCISAIRKWIPEYTRASTISSIACEKLVNLLVVFEAALSPLNFISSVPKNAFSV
jgi:hypothetical protein